jgi:hypothetical protein
MRFVLSSLFKLLLSFDVWNILVFFYRTGTYLSHILRCFRLHFLITVILTHPVDPDKVIGSADTTAWIYCDNSVLLRQNFAKQSVTSSARYVL